MKTIRQLGSTVVRIAIAFCLLFGMGVRSDAQEKTSAQKFSGTTKKLPVAASPQTAGAENPSGGPQEGIKVHGDWTIVIRNQDGSVAGRHDFQNALVNLAVLPQILAHGGGVGQWVVSIGASTIAQPCSLSLGTLGGLPAACNLTESSGPPSLGTLTVTASATDLTLRGTVRADNSAQLAGVSTSFALCVPPQVPSAACTQVNGGAVFTGRDITSLNIAVQAGQTMDVTVKISFS